jgi:hypothetical protein
MGRRPFPRNNSGSLAMLAAMRRASSLGAMLSIPPASRSPSIRRTRSTPAARASKVCRRENAQAGAEPSRPPDETPSSAGSSSFEIRRMLASEVDNGIPTQCVRMMM